MVTAWGTYGAAVHWKSQERRQPVEVFVGQVQPVVLAGLHAGLVLRPRAAAPGQGYGRPARVVDGFGATVYNGRCHAPAVAVHLPPEDLTAGLAVAVRRSHSSASQIDGRLLFITARRDAGRRRSS